MSRKFPIQADYHFATWAAERFLIDEGICALPFDPYLIAKRHKWRIRPFSKIVNKDAGRELNKFDQLTALGGLWNLDGYVSRPVPEKYVILYNDISFSGNRIVFTLTHEIAHIVLGHLDEFDCTKLSRGGLKEKEYEILEKEANCFARNVLAPHIVVSQLRQVDFINNRNIFNLSKKAWETRVNLLQEDIFNGDLKARDILKKQFHNFIRRRHCEKCNSFYLSTKGSLYCPICGSKNIEWSDKGVKYPVHYKLDENGKAKVCPICDNEDLAEGEYCKICGLYVINKCASVDYDGNPICERPASGNARFCSICGSTTTFFKKELLKPWEDEKPSLEEMDEDSLPF